MKKSPLLLLLVAFTTQAYADVPIEVIPNKGAPMADSAVTDLVKSKIDLAQYQSVQAQVVSNHPGVVDSILVYLRNSSEVTSTSIKVDPLRKVREELKENTPENEKKEKLLADSTTVFCPDDSVQFIAFSHRKLPWDQKSANEVADAAEKAGLKTVRLLKQQATRQNYLNYLSCPKLVGDFYDGDANPHELETHDNAISAQDISIVLKGAFRHQVTHVWVACKAFNNPMLSAMVDDAQSRKFIAGVVDLVGGYADRTGVCTMKAALAGQSISKSFEECHAKFDLKSYNKWGVAGDGPDFLLP